MDKLITTGLVNNAYGSSSKLQGGAGAIASPEETAGVNFAELVRNAAQNTVTTVREAEQVQQAGLVGEVSAQQVVEATMEMETTLRLAVSVRDRLVEAYQQIMQMPI
ncbi:MAG: flagellar hook-basal body complex protein FliE [Pseudomonadota bacterium]|jgi:flagellar hook-basal body complex protein FliE|uniref:flagellar hook-basal body complex protein FliE n=1 Tax=Pseudooceanicola nitratireducens TaxID=517719 RepID=UPI000B2DAA69|nr:flagellar hook-basal body complex protein FliE [Pseudooceanicola nitratireducens]MBY6159153.1 flagellar hook-basal body complex protein FliE [Pseudooceanicola nitratireducens]MBY6167485.1 flagellar hook-basal body complex protein FliE [Pseudooceanicola nitratireducens]MEC7297105.1 flagellar hook-basal body complex protein FliE [Pseudomonadota bacterium]MEC8666949.1 flagellar hook-basal body complex protein FliE [Pseudomonadota bacterium]